MYKILEERRVDMVAWVDAVFNHAEFKLQLKQLGLIYRRYQQRYHSDQFNSQMAALEIKVENKKEYAIMLMQTVKEIYPDILSKYALVSQLITDREHLAKYMMNDVMHALDRPAQELEMLNSFIKDDRQTWRALALDSIDDLVWAQHSLLADRLIAKLDAEIEQEWHEKEQYRREKNQFRREGEEALHRTYKSKQFTEMLELLGNVGLLLESASKGCLKMMEAVAYYLESTLDIDASTNPTLETLSQMLNCPILKLICLDSVHITVENLESLSQYRGGMPIFIFYLGDHVNAYLKVKRAQWAGDANIPPLLLTEIEKREPRLEAIKREYETRLQEEYGDEDKVIKSPSLSSSASSDIQVDSSNDHSSAECEVGEVIVSPSVSPVVQTGGPQLFLPKDNRGSEKQVKPDLRSEYYCLSSV